MRLQEGKKVTVKQLSRIPVSYTSQRRERDIEQKQRKVGLMLFHKVTLAKVLSKEERKKLKSDYDDTMNQHFQALNVLSLAEAALVEFDVEGQSVINEQCIEEQSVAEEAIVEQQPIIEERPVVEEQPIIEEQPVIEDQHFDSCIGSPSLADLGSTSPEKSYEKTKETTEDMD
ncbi:unnamed protein product [Mycena citricolor]|uniref:Uncharacterized protein n=1 Tax=Mycena citricolor TaxID=2018698 RepID=A0AAD2H2D7_9AGAR|nr:unnamed protein product [Mycena citricolor]